MNLPKITIQIIKLSSLLSIFGVGVYAILWPYTIIHFALGVLIGILLSTSRIIILSRAVNKNLINIEDAKMSKAKLNFNHVLRYLITIVVLFLVAVYLHYISILGTFYSLIAFQVAIYTSNVMLKNK